MATKDSDDERALVLLAARAQAADELSLAALATVDFTPATIANTVSQNQALLKSNIAGIIHYIRQTSASNA